MVYLAIFTKITSVIDRQTDKTVQYDYKCIILVSDYQTRAQA